MGCTEPIAVAYAGTLARKTLGTVTEQVQLTVSDNIIKCEKCHRSPHWGRKGLRTAVAAGICYGNADSELEVLSDATQEQQEGLDSYDRLFYGDNGILVKGVENTIHMVSAIAREGMRESDSKIIHIHDGK